MLVLDASKSIGAASTQVKAAATTLVNAFKDTNTRVGITSFAGGPIQVQPLVDDTSDSAAVTGALGSTIAAYTPSTAEGTNWEAGIRTASQLFTTAGARAGVTQLMIVVTDGAPNYYLNGAGVPVAGTNYPSASQDSMQAAADRANIFKAAGGRMPASVSAATSATVGATTRISYLERISQYAVQLTPVTRTPIPRRPTYAPVGQTADPVGTTNPITATRTRRSTRRRPTR
jgi:Mg-chelatase subunit ChlD